MLGCFAGFVIFAGQGSGNEDGRPSFFNDRGELAFYAEFTDGTSGLFVSSAVAVPEPRTFILMALALLLWRRGQRRIP